jgi:NarL family two-component system response regulator LiaR
VKWIETRFLFFSNSFQLFVLFLAILFTGLGIWIAKQISKPQIQTVIVEKPIYIDKDEAFEVDLMELKKRKISKRELEVLSLIASGKSNREIADQLFVSVPTIKTHIANLFEKLEARRRTQVIEKAKRLRLIK